MPQATDELRAEWPGQDEEAVAYLEDQGFVLMPGFYWRRPGGDHVITPREASAIYYLIDEWDFDGVEEA